MISLTILTSATWASTIRAFMAPGVEKALGAAVTQTAQRGAERCRQVAPRRTGHLAGSYQVLPLGTGQATISAAAYAPYVRTGTRRRPGNPALQQVMAQEIPEIAADELAAAARTVAQHLAGR